MGTDQTTPRSNMFRALAMIRMALRVFYSVSPTVRVGADCLARIRPPASGSRARGWISRRLMIALPGSGSKHGSHSMWGVVVPSSR